MAEAARERRDLETPEQQRARLDDVAEAARARRAQETPQQRQRRADVQAEGDHRRQQQPAIQQNYARPPGITDGRFVTRMTKMYQDLTSGFDNPTCTICKENFPSLKVRQVGDEQICDRCCRKPDEPQYGVANNMVPGPVPPELSDLTAVEEMLVARVLAVTSVHRLPLGQIGYKGHVIFFPQDITDVAESLPRTSVNIVVLKRRHHVTGDMESFRVRRARVLEALLWLKNHNLYYHDVIIDYAATQTLPEDGPFTGLTIREEEAEDESDEENERPDHPDPDGPVHETAESFVPNIRQRTERQHISDRAAEVLNWPAAAREPVSEFRTEGYLSMAFPTLFPDGAGDISSPRLQRISAANYFRHLMLLEDGRFARHHRFRYVALNTVLRWRALTSGRVYIAKHPGTGALTVQELRQLAGQGDTSFAKSVYHFGSSLAGSPSYWSLQRSRLVQMVEQLGLPTHFITLSAADLQWPELFQLLGLPEGASLSARAAALNSNPLHADWLFWRRVCLFMQAYYVDLLGAVDYWIRVEYQHRGSPHVHGLVWLRDAPSLEHLEDESRRQNVIAYIDSHVSTQHPVGRDNMWDIRGHPSAVKYADVEDRQRDLAELTSFCLIHRCRRGTCLKTVNGREQCRFGYPKDLIATTTLVTGENGTVTVNTKRNDPLVNSHSVTQLAAWRGNVDTQPCVDKERVINYAAKYSTKQEVQSGGLRGALATVLQHLQGDEPALKVAQKLLTGAVGHRDISSQETAHQLLQLPLFKATREFVHVSTSSAQVRTRKVFF